MTPLPVVDRAATVRAAQAQVGPLAGLHLRQDVPDWPTWIENHPFIPRENFYDYSAAFRRVEIVRSCTSVLAGDLAKQPIRVWRGRGKARVEVEALPGTLGYLLEHPTVDGRVTGYHLRKAWTIAFVLWGNTAWQMIRLQGGKSPVTELWQLPWSTQQVIPTELRDVAAFRTWRGTYDDVDAAQVIHFHDWNPDDEPIGSSRMESIRSEFEAIYYAVASLREYYRRGGRLSSVYVVKETQGKVSQESLTEKAMTLKQRWGGWDKQWDPVITSALEQAGDRMKLSEMELEKTFSLINLGICRAMGVPPTRVGLNQMSAHQGGGAVADADTNNYWLGTLKDLALERDSVINARLAPLFGPDIWVETDFSGEMAVQQAMYAQAKSLVIMTGRPVSTVNEARDIIGMPESEDPSADELFVPQKIDRGTVAPGGVGEGAAPSDVATDPGAGDEPPPQGRKVAKARVAMIRRPAGGRESLRRRADANLARYERRTERFVTGYFEGQREQAKARAKSAALARTGLIAVRLDDLLPDPTEEERARFRELVAALVADRGEEALSDLAELTEAALEARFESQSARAAAFVRSKAATMFDQIDQTTRELMADTVAPLIERGVTNAEGEWRAATAADVVQAIDHVFDDRVANAPTIARTETAGAYNFATHEAWAQSGVDGLQREWVSARDSAVRETHREADGQVVGLDEPFLVGGEQLAFPGDPQGTPDEICNCRCVASPVLDGETLAHTARDAWAKWLAPPSTNGHAPRNRLKEWAA